MKIMKTFNLTTAVVAAIGFFGLDGVHGNNMRVTSFVAGEQRTRSEDNVNGSTVFRGSTSPERKLKKNAKKNAVASPTPEPTPMGTEVYSLEELHAGLKRESRAWGGSSRNLQSTSAGPGEVALTKHAIPIGEGSNCGLGAPFSPLTGCGTSTTLFQSIPSCAELPKPNTQACLGDLETSGLISGYATWLLHIVSKAGDAQSEVKKAAEVSASGYGVEVTASMSEVAKGGLTTQSGGVYLTATANDVKHKVIEHPAAFKLAETAVAAFKEGPAKWKAMGYSAYYVIELSYGGYFNGGYTFNSKSTDSTSAFEAAASFSGSGWGVSGNANAQYSKTVTKYESTVTKSTFMDCSPATCLGAGVTETESSELGAGTVPTELIDAHSKWYNGLEDGGQVAAIHVASLRQNNQFVALFLADQQSDASKWNQTTFDALFAVPGPTFMHKWNTDKFLALAKINTLSKVTGACNMKSTDKETLTTIKRRMNVKKANIERAVDLSYLINQETSYLDSSTFASSEQCWLDFMNANNDLQVAMCNSKTCTTKAQAETVEGWWSTNTANPGFWEGRQACPSDYRPGGIKCQTMKTGYSTPWAECPFDFTYASSQNIPVLPKPFYTAELNEIYCPANYERIMTKEDCTAYYKAINNGARSGLAQNPNPDFFADRTDGYIGGSAVVWGDALNPGDANIVTPYNSDTHSKGCFIWQGKYGPYFNLDPAAPNYATYPSNGCSGPLNCDRIACKLTSQCGGI